jgi:hypothetical protein
MPRAPKDGFEWVSIQLTKRVKTTLNKAAKSDQRSLNEYAGRVLNAHAAMLDTLDDATFKQLAVLSSLPAEQQAAVLERARQQFIASQTKEKS